MTSRPQRRHSTSWAAVHHRALTLRFGFGPAISGSTVRRTRAGPHSPWRFFALRRQALLLTCGVVGDVQGATAALSYALLFHQAAHLFHRAERFLILAHRSRAAFQALFLRRVY